MLCRKCNIEHLEDMFRKDQSRMNGRHPYCKSCEKLNKREWYLKNIDHVKNKAKENRLKNKEQYAATKKKWQQANPDKIRAIALKSNFGISLEQYSLMLQSQHGLCSICKTPPKEDVWLCVDHCHKTGSIRGLLCDHCNKLLGFAKDSEQILQSAILYLRDDDNEKERK